MLIPTPRIVTSHGDFGPSSIWTLDPSDCLGSLCSFRFNDPVCRRHRLMAVADAREGQLVRGFLGGAVVTIQGWDLITSWSCSSHRHGRGGSTLEAVELGIDPWIAG
jgi:hypothetical protein